MNVETTGEETPCLLEWRVHLARLDRGRLPLLLLVIGGAASCVWLMFRAWLPALAAVFLLAGAAREYLFPLTYRVTAGGVCVSGMLIQSAIPWTAVKRLLPDVNGIVLTPLPVPSRLDSFRGVCIRFAPDGEPGDRASVMELVRQLAPPLQKVDTAADERE